MAKKWLERDLEDYIVNHPQELFKAVNPWREPTDIQVLGRQINCRYGRIDLLLQQKNILLLVELKRNRAKENAVGQLVRYKNAIIEVCDYDSLYNVYMREESDIWIDPEHSKYISCILVASSFSSAALDAMSHEGFAIKVHHNDDGFSLEGNIGSDKPKGQPELERILDGWIKTSLGYAMGQHMIRKAYQHGILKLEPPE